MDDTFHGRTLVGGGGSASPAAHPSAVASSRESPACADRCTRACGMALPGSLHPWGWGSAGVVVRLSWRLCLDRRLVVVAFISYIHRGCNFSKIV